MKLKEEELSQRLVDRGTQTQLIVSQGLQVRVSKRGNYEVTLDKEYANFQSFKENKQNKIDSSNHIGVQIELVREYRDQATRTDMDMSEIVRLLQKSVKKKNNVKLPKNVKLKKRLSACESGVSFHTSQSNKSRKTGHNKKGMEDMSPGTTFHNLQDIIESNNHSPKSPDNSTLVL